MQQNEKKPQNPEELTDQEQSPNQVALDNIRYFFEQVICKIPHGSENCEGLSDWIVKFAKERNLKVSQDEKKNVVVIAPATQGCENAKPVILQAHLDMVAVSKNDQFDMKTHTIETIVEGDWMKANETSLGADDGMGVAMMLYILDDDSIKHPQLVCIFTVDEEIGAIGAKALDLRSIPYCKFAINLDWEVDKEVCVGSAGAKQVKARKSLSFVDTKGGNIIKLSIAGLSGGHSAIAIGNDGANAIKLAVDALYSVELPYYFGSIYGGQMMSAIPTECSVVICAVPENTEQLVLSLKNSLDSAQERYSRTDPEMKYDIVVEENQCTSCVSLNDTAEVIGYLHDLPTGAIAMDCNMPNTAETSLNLGVVSTTENVIDIEFLLRSSIDSKLEALYDELQKISSKYDAETSVGFTVATWEPNWDYPLLDLFKDAFKEVTGKDVIPTITHGGLECPEIMKKLSGSQWVSMGSTIEKPHTPDERVSIPSIVQAFAVLCNILSKIAEETE